MHIKQLIITILSTLVTTLAAAQSFDGITSSATKLISIGEAFIQADNIEKAEQLYIKAIEAAITPTEKWNAVDHLASLYSSMEKYNLALESYNRLLADPEIYSSEPILLRTYAGMGRIYHEKHDYVRAIKSFEQARRYIDSSTNDFLPVLLCDVARTLTVAGDVYRAEALLDSAISMSQKPEFGAVLADAYRAKALLYERVGDYRRAYENMSSHANLRQNLGEREISTLLNSTNPLSTQQKVESVVRYERQLKELEERRVMEHKQLERAGQIAYIVGLMLLFSLCILLWCIILLIRNRRKVKALEESNKEKRRIMSIVAHDFVNPFNALIGFAELQMQYAASQNNAELLDYSRVMYNSSQTLFQMVGNVLSWSQLDGQLKSKRQQLNIGVEIEKAVDVYRLMAEDKHIHLNVIVDDSMEICADPNHLSIIVRNVLSNAMKFTPDGGRITISAVSNGNRTSITVDDNGVGISEENIKKFNSNIAISSTVGTGQEKGLGLGLTICRDMMRANHGIFELSSSVEGGTTVTLIFDNKA